MMQIWKARLPVLENDDVVAGWFLCVMPGVRQDLNERKTGEHRDAVSRVVRRLHNLPNPNPNKIVHEWTADKIVEVFWTEYKNFDRRLGHYGEEGRWKSAWVRQGKSHLWHEQHSLPYTKVLGFVACRVTSKCLGIGAAERAWGAVKEIKSGKKSHRGCKSTEKRAIVYTTARIEEARIKVAAMEDIEAKGEDAMFGDDDIK